MTDNEKLGLIEALVMAAYAQGLNVGQFQNRNVTRAQYENDVRNAVHEGHKGPADATGYLGKIQTFTHRLMEDS